VDRKIVKRPVMTSVYGVTAVGARDQVLEVLRDRRPDLSREKLYEVSHDLSRRTLDGISEVCPEADRLMRWVREAGRAVVETGNLMSWTTPLGFPVVQPYRRWSSVCVNTIMGRLIVQAPSMGRSRSPKPKTAAPHKRKQSNGAAPNWIHSLDSTHMLMTARETRQRGAPFGNVHDSFWTLASRSGQLAADLRDTFVELHQEPQQHRLYRELRDRHPTAEIPEPPETGDFDLDKVRDAPFFFSP